MQHSAIEHLVCRCSPAAQGTDICNHLVHSSKTPANFSKCASMTCTSILLCICSLFHPVMLAHLFSTSSATLSIHLLDSCKTTRLASTAALIDHVNTALVPGCLSVSTLIMSIAFPMTAMLTVEFTSCTQLPCDVESGYGLAPCAASSRTEPIFSTRHDLGLAVQSLSAWHEICKTCMLAETCWNVTTLVGNKVAAEVTSRPLLPWADTSCGSAPDRSSRLHWSSQDELIDACRTTYCTLHGFCPSPCKVNAAWALVKSRKAAAIQAETESIFRRMVTPQ